MTDQIKFEIDNARVLHEVIDGEAVIINLERGIYYSTRDVGAEIWELVSAGHSLAETADRLAAQYKIGRESASSAVLGFVGELLEEELLTIADAEGSELGTGWCAHSQPTESKRFPRPVLKKYTDMSEMLVLDPIHDLGVDVPQADPTGESAS